MKKKITEKLKSTKEQQMVVGPIVQYLCELGWDLEQIIFGKNEWKVPKSPSEASKRERGESFAFFPVDIAIFDKKENCGDYRNLVCIIECKQPDINVGVQQLEDYLSLEPHVKVGIWANSADKSAVSKFIYKSSTGLSIPKTKIVKNMPSPSTDLSESANTLTFNDLEIPSVDSAKQMFSELLDLVVARDGNVTRREDQLDQLCNLILLKLDSDKKGKLDPTAELEFHCCNDEIATSENVKKLFSSFLLIYPDIFITQSDKEIRFSNSTIDAIVEKLAPYNLLGIGSDAVSIAFQTLRSAALKQGEGQYFTPTQVIQAAIKILGVDKDDIILDPACGTGGFLIQSFLEMKGKYAGSNEELSKWAQLHIYGIDKDAIGIKLTKAIMQILGDGSAHCVRGDSVLTHTWSTEYPHLVSSMYSNKRFSKIYTNPPFGAPLKVKYMDAKKSGLSITEYLDKPKDIELGLLMFNRCVDLLQDSGKLCIVLPETYFFSPSYQYVREWAKKRIKPLCVINIPMEAFQGFCRAKTNLYIFEKLDEQSTGWNTGSVIFMDPKTCGIYKNGGDLYVVDANGKRTQEIDNELQKYAEEYSKGNLKHATSVPLVSVYKKDVCVPQYYNKKYKKDYQKMLTAYGINSVSLEHLIKRGIITVLSGHGSPSNDQRNGVIPYIKVSDIRNMRININPTNLIPLALAQKFWHTKDGVSDIHAWDIITPNRASSNIGEFSIIMPGEENIVLTKEVFIIRVNDNDIGITPFYLLWAFSLTEVRNQWRRVTLMQTNREDVGTRYKEIEIPLPPDQMWAANVSKPFSDYFQGIANAKALFLQNTNLDAFNYIASVSTFIPQQDGSGDDFDDDFDDNDFG